MRDFLARFWRRPRSAPPRAVQPAIPRPRRMSSREYEAYQLYILAEAGVERVRLVTGTARGPECDGVDGFEMSLEDAMRLAPLPHELGPGRWCHCTYRPVAELT